MVWLTLPQSGKKEKQSKKTNASQYTHHLRFPDELGDGFGTGGFPEDFQAALALIPLFPWLSEWLGE